MNGPQDRDIRYQWLVDMFRPDLVHLANINGKLHVAQGRSYVFAVDGRTADFNKPEVLGLSSRCPDCVVWTSGRDRPLA